MKRVFFLMMLLFFMCFVISVNYVNADNDIVRLIERSEQLVKEGQYQKAANLLESIDEENMEADVLIKKSIIYHYLKDYKTSEKIINYIRKNNIDMTNKNKFKLFFISAKNNMAMKNYKIAVKYFKKAIKYNPKYIKSYLYIADIFNRNNSYKKSEKYLDVYFKKADVMAINELAIQLQFDNLSNMFRMEDIIKIADRLKNIRPDLEYEIEKLVLFYAFKYSPVEYISKLEILQKLHPNDKSLTILAANFYWHTREYDGFQLKFEKIYPKLKRITEEDNEIEKQEDIRFFLPIAEEIIKEYQSERKSFHATQAWSTE